MSDSLKFGTSGLRGLVTELVGEASRRWTAAFLAHLEDVAASGDRKLYVGRDLRSSSPAIAADCMGAASRAGWQVIDCGALPTPALALAAMSAGAPAVMVTGSHIPDDRNGLKFYMAAGEITKADEAGIQGHVGAAPQAADAGVAPIDLSDQVLEAYRRRYLDFFPADALAGLTVGLYEQSSVARDVLRTILDGLGARVMPFSRAAHFIPVDTEAHRPEDISLLANFAATHSVDAIVSTDGDADRPLVADGSGEVVRGDLLGLLTADFLNLRTVVTPLTSSSAMEKSGVAKAVLRTKVGSPFVIAGMERALEAGGTDVVGFEANGGVLQASAVARDGRTLAALPTRDAMLPIICALASSRAKAIGLRALVDQLGAGHALGNRLQEIPSERSGRLLAQLADDQAFASAFFSDVGGITAKDDLDGVRFVLNDGATVHFRASGNAPELRCYVEADAPERARHLLDWGLRKAAAELA